MRVGVEFASKSIRNGIEKRKTEIHFPQKFTFALKIIGLLPKSVQQFLIKKALAY